MALVLLKDFLVLFFFMETLRFFLWKLRRQRTPRQTWDIQKLKSFKDTIPNCLTESFPTRLSMRCNFQYQPMHSSWPAWCEFKCRPRTSTTRAAIAHNISDHFRSWNNWVEGMLHNNRGLGLSCDTHSYLSGTNTKHTGFASQQLFTAIAVIK